jgi:hypothetical protein
VRVTHITRRREALAAAEAEVDEAMALMTRTLIAEHLVEVDAIEYAYDEALAAAGWERTPGGEYPRPVQVPQAGQ